MPYDLGKSQVPHQQWGVKQSLMGRPNTAVLRLVVQH